MPDLVPVILAGGVGSRLWPVSRADRPKQFQVLLGELSLFQRTAQRCADPQRYESPIIVTGAEYRDTALEQLGEILVGTTKLRAAFGAKFVCNATATNQDA